MPEPREAAALVTLLRRGDRPWPAYAELVEEAGSAVVVLERERDAGRVDLQGDLVDGDPLAPVLEHLASWKAAGFELLTGLDDVYPSNLKSAHDRPPVIFAVGSLSAADARSVAVVGARKSTCEGEKVAREITQCLVSSNYVAVSGLAAGIDTTVHEAAIAAGGRTIAVIGTGLEFVYPQENAELQQRLARDCAVLSPFWPDTPPSKSGFRIRNGVIAGLSLASVIVEAGATSGTRIVARRALNQGRPVLLWHALMAQDWARDLAKRPGTHVFSRAQEAVEVIERLTSPGTLVP